MSLKEAGHEEYLAARKLLAEWFITCKSLYAVLLNYTVIYINKKQKKKKKFKYSSAGHRREFSAFASKEECCRFISTCLLPLARGVGVGSPGSSRSRSGGGARKVRLLLSHGSSSSQARTFIVEYGRSLSEDKQRYKYNFF